MSQEMTQTVALTAADEAEIRNLYFRVLDGWNRGSGEGFAEPFAEDGEQVAFDGTHFKGRAEIASFHQQLFDTFLKGSRLVGKVRSVRPLTPDVAVLHAVGGTVMAGKQDLDTDRNSVQALVAIRQSGKWQIALFVNVRAQYWGRPEAVQALTEELRQEL